METYQKNVQEWLTSAVFDESTKNEIKDLREKNPSALEDAFYQTMAFGTGGMRGIMGAGTNRINKYTLGAATQGLSNYLKEQFPEDAIKVVIAHDVRHNSDAFAQIVANVLSANDIQVFLFDGFRPAPELSFAVKHLGCKAGIVLTASHNPPEYNGYKVYWEDGGQIVPPHDKAIIAQVNQTKYSDIQFNGKPELISKIGAEVDEVFISACVENAKFQDIGKQDLKIVFSSLHGTSIQGMPQALKKAGFSQTHIVEEQADPNGDFPTVESPNPEEPSAMKMALELAHKVEADLVLATDPDADRIGVGVKNLNGDFQLLNGNQANTVLTHYLLNEWKKLDKLNGNQFIGSTIVTSDIFYKIAELFGAECQTGLTGFKWISDMIRRQEGEKEFVCGGEESFGFMVGDFVRDKDSITTALVAAEIAAVKKAEGSSFFEYLVDIYTQTGLYLEALSSLKKTGKEGAEEIKEMMLDFRENPPKEFAGSPVVEIRDYLKSKIFNLQDGTETPTNIPPSNVLIFCTMHGDKIAIRPSGTEPKIKFYFSVKDDLNAANQYADKTLKLTNRIKELKQSVGL